MTIAQIKRAPTRAQLYGGIVGLWVILSFSVSARAEAPACSLVVVDTVTILSIIDGDTLETDKGPIRLASVEAPKPFGFGSHEDAALAFGALGGLATGQRWNLAPINGLPDRYGRLHAHLFDASGQWLQAELVRRGLVRVRPNRDENQCLRALLRAEAGAREDKSGFWATPQHRPKSVEDPSLSKQIGLYQLVEGSVRSVGRGRSMVFLDFGADFRRDFTVMVSIDAEARFAEEGLDLDSLVGQSIRVRGVIEASGGPAIRVDDPALIEVLDTR